MYVESVGASTGNTMVTTAAKTVTPITVEKAVETESMEGEKQQPNKDVSAIYSSSNDSRISDERQITENEKVKKAIETMKAQLPNAEIKFGIHEKTDRVTIKIVDKQTEEVIKEFPPEKTLDMIAKCMEIAGVLVDEKL